MFKSGTTTYRVVSYDCRELGRIITGVRFYWFKFSTKLLSICA